MGGISESFGNVQNIKGTGGAFDATLVPVELLRNMRLRPISITISGADQITFTVLGSVTHTAPIWAGTDYQRLKENLAYTWQATALNTILSSAGVVTPLQAPATGIWYYYIGLVSGVPTLYPSQTAPVEAQGRFEGGPLSHPGTSRVRSYMYVGFHLCDATTPTFVPMTKIGYTYHTGDITVATTATWAELAFTGAKALPKHGYLGLTVAGQLETGANGSVIVSGNATDGVGGQTVSDSAGVTIAPFSGIPTTVAGKLWAKDTTARGDVHVLEITDVV